MASSLNAATSGGGGVIVTSDASGDLNIQSGGSTVVAVTSAGVAVTGTLSSSGASTLTGAITATAGINTPNTFGFKNRIINGGMVVSQYNGTTAVTPTGASQSTIDRFIGVNTQSAKLTYQQVADAPAGFVNSFKILVASAATPSSSDQFRFGQSIEGFNTADFGWGTANAQAVTVSFRAKVSVAGTYSVAIWNGANGRSYVTTVSLTTSWATYSVTFPGDTTGTWGTGDTVGIELIFDTGAGSNWVAPANNAWQAGNYFKASGSVSLVSNASATLNITGVQLEKGSTATSFDYRPYGTELQLAQRYYWNAAKGTNLSINGYCFSATQYNAPITFPVQMRASPSLNIVTGSGFYTLDSSGANAITVGTIFRPTVYGALVFFTVASGLSGFAGGLNMDNAACNIAFSAEL